MASRLASFLPRFVVLPLIALLGTATLTFAAETQLTPAQPTAQPAAASVPGTLVVPHVRRQAFVFAKGTLEDAGFAWKVVGPVAGYAANIVVNQNPLPGTRVVDTGAPTMKLSLAANKSYGQQGSLENAAPYAGTELKFAGNAPAMEADPLAQPAPVDDAASAAKPAKRTHAKQPKPKQPKPKSNERAAAARPPAFAVAGAPNEPLDEMPLPDRARLLGRYVAKHPSTTSAVVNHFLYQHSWIVTGAEFGWWRGAEALKLLIAVDRQAREKWGFGARSGGVAGAALARVLAKSK